MNDRILKMKPLNFIKYLWPIMFIINTTNCIFKGKYCFTIVHIFMICCFVQGFHPFIKKLWKSNITDMNRNELFESILGFMSMVMEIIWFELIWDIGIQANIDHSVTIRWNCYVTLENTIPWIFVDRMDSFFEFD